MNNLKKLLNVQKDFNETLYVKPSAQDYVFALNIEISELLNTLPWKWWKKEQPIDKTAILDELADVLAFWLSWHNDHIDEIVERLEEAPEKTKEDLIHTLEFNINYGIAKEQGLKPKLHRVEYETNDSLKRYTGAGRRLGLLIAIVMHYTNATMLEITDAYNTKMQVNYNRQKTKY